MLYSIHSSFSLNETLFSCICGVSFVRDVGHYVTMKKIFADWALLLIFTDAPMQSVVITQDKCLHHRRDLHYYWNQRLLPRDETRACCEYLVFMYDLRCVKVYLNYEHYY